MAAPAWVSSLLAALRTSDLPAHSPVSHFFKVYLFVSMYVYRHTHKRPLMHVFVSCVCTHAHTYANMHEYVTLSYCFCLGSPD